MSANNYNHKQKNNFNQLKEISLNFNHFNRVTILTLISLIIGIFLKSIFTEYTRYNFKYLVIGGLPIFTKNHILISIIFNIIFLLNVFYLLIKEKRSIEKSHNNDLNFNLFKVLTNIRFSYIFKSIISLITFLVLYNFLVIPIKDTLNFKISGHICSTMFANITIISKLNVSDHFLKYNIKYNIFNLYRKLAYALLLHNIWSLIFTMWLYHSIFECLTAYIISYVCTFIIFSFDIDYILIFILNPKLTYDKSDRISSDINDHTR